MQVVAGDQQLGGVGGGGGQQGRRDRAERGVGGLAIQAEGSRSGQVDDDGMVVALPDGDGERPPVGCGLGGRVRGYRAVRWCCWGWVGGADGTQQAPDGRGEEWVGGGQAGVRRLEASGAALVAPGEGERGRDRCGEGDPDDAAGGQLDVGAGWWYGRLVSVGRAVGRAGRGCGWRVVGWRGAGGRWCRSPLGSRDLVGVAVGTGWCRGMLDPWPRRCGRSGVGRLVGGGGGVGDRKDPAGADAVGIGQPAAVRLGPALVVVEDLAEPAAVAEVALGQVPERVVRLHDMLGRPTVGRCVLMCCWWRVPVGGGGWRDGALDGGVGGRGWCRGDGGPYRGGQWGQQQGRGDQPGGQGLGAPGGQRHVASEPAVEGGFGLHGQAGEELRPGKPGEGGQPVEDDLVGQGLVQDRGTQIGGCGHGVRQWPPDRPPQPHRQGNHDNSPDGQGEQSAGQVAG